MQSYYKLASLRFAARAAASRTASSVRTLATFAPDPTPSQFTSQETRDVADLDGLMSIVRKATGPDHHNHIPQRTPGTWTDAIRSQHASLPPRVFPSASPPPPKPLATHQTPPASSTTSAPEPLPPRQMHDSYSEIVLPFSTQPTLMDEYVNAWGGLRTGKMMEHLDSVAASSAYKHMLGPAAKSAEENRSFYMVTASCDRLDMLAPLVPGQDVRLSGQVIYVGKSSMEVVVKMESLNPSGDAQTLLLGRFSMVCRDAQTDKARVVNPLLIETPEEKALLALGEAHKNTRQNLALRSLSRVQPTATEFANLHAFYLKYGCEAGEPVLAPGEERVWMSDTRLEVCQLMFPQHRNIHQKVFGGYLMRLAYELGFTNASLFARKPVRFLSLDKIAFARPVPIGSILRLHSTVHHSASTAQFPALIHVGVKASVVDVETGKELTTNDFRFTWCRERGEPLKRIVVPKTSGEVMLWFEAQREMETNTRLSK